MDENEKKDNFTNDDIFHYLMKFKDEVSKDNKQLEKKVDNFEQKIEKKLEKMRKDMEENKLAGGSMLEEINKRIDMIEKEVFKKNANDKDKMTKSKKNEQEERERKRRKQEEEDRERQRTEKSIQEELKEASENEDRHEDTTEKEFETEANEWIEAHVRSKPALKNTRTKKINVKERGMRKLKKWFCDSDSETDDDNPSSSEEEGEGEKNWETVQRVKKNEEKRKTRRTLLEKKKSSTSSKASMIVGLGPITKLSVDFFEKQLKDFEKAKYEAVKEYLSHFLNYESDEIEELGIESTQLAKDDVMYVAFSDQSNIRELYGRIAASQNLDIVTRNFVPPQFFERYMFISRKCRELRESNSNVKTQMRFGRQDVEVLTKSRGTEEPYKLVSLNKICYSGSGMEEVIPEFDNSIKWKKKKDKQPRRPPPINPRRGKPPSMWLEGEPPLDSRHQLSRTSSQNDAPKKKPKKAIDDMNVDENESI